MIADSRVYEEIIDGTRTPPEEKEAIGILDKDDEDTKKLKKEKLAVILANKKGYRDLVMSTEGISWNIVENATSDKLSKGALRKAWGRLERRWKYGLVGIHGEKMTELLNTGHKMDDEMFITHLLNSVPQSEYEGAILVVKDKLRKEIVDLPEMEQILEDKYESMKHVKGWDEE